MRLAIKEYPSVAVRLPVTAKQRLDSAHREFMDMAQEFEHNIEQARVKLQSAAEALCNHPRDQVVRQINERGVDYSLCLNCGETD